MWETGVDSDGVGVDDLFGISGDWCLHSFVCSSRRGKLIITRGSRTRTGLKMCTKSYDSTSLSLTVN